MADYYPLLARALDALPDRSPAMRKAVYERARKALIGQLRSLDPPLAEADIDTERTALDGAIERLEATYAPPPEPAPEPVVAPAPNAIPEPAPPEPAPVADDALFEAEPQPGAVSGLPPATAPDLGLQSAPEPKRREGPPLAITPRRGKDAASPGSADVEPVQVSPSNQPPLEEAEAASAIRAEAAGGQKRPRVAVVPAGGRRSRTLRNVFVGGVLAVVIGLIAVAAFLLRDRPADLQPTGADIAGAPADRTDSKFADRVGGEAGPATERPAASPAGKGSAAPAAQQPASQPPAQSDVTVAQRAVLVEENLADQNAPPPVTQGRVVWRLDSVSGEQGQPLETAVVATIDFPEAALQLVMTIQRNLDATLPASHTVKLVFTATGPAGEKRVVQDVGLLAAKDDENARGSPLAGLPVRVRDNLFLIGLSSLRNDVDRNTEMLLHKPWFDLALKYTSGQRAVITFEKGSAGAQAMQRAFDQWK